MADVTIVAPSSQVQTVGGAQQSQGGAQAQHPSLPQGSLVSGTIAGKDTSGNYLLKTSQGTFALRSSAPLTYNSDVTIRIGANSAGSTSARIVSVNGEPFADFSAPVAEGTDSLGGTLLAQGAGVTGTDTSQSQPTGIRALVVSAPAPAEGQPANTGVTQGATVIVRANPAPPAAAATGQQEGQPPANAEQAAAPIASSANVAAQPEQVAQNPQPPALQPVPAAPQPQNAAATHTPVSYSTATAVETELAPAETVTQASQDQTSNQTGTSPGQQQAAAQPEATVAQTQTLPQPEATGAQPPAAPPQVATTPQASPSNASLYSAYTKQTATPQATPEQPGTATPAAGSANEPLTAQVVSTGENGTLNLATPLGPVTVQASSVPSLSALPAGTALTLEVVATATTAAAVAPASTSSPATLNELAASWQSLKDIVSTTAGNEGAASNAVLARLPTLGPGFVSQSTAFISALMQGEARKLLGDDTIDALRENGREDLIEKFTGEAAMLSSTYNAPVSHDAPNWQAFFLPFVFQEALQQARLYVKREAPKKDRAGKQAGDTRFVVEVDLSEVGPLQLDGLVRKKEANTAFDLVIRSHTSFSAEDQSEILAIYNNAAELTGFKGTLSFQVTKDFTVKPLEEIHRQSLRGITA